MAQSRLQNTKSFLDNSGIPQKSRKKQQSSKYLQHSGMLLLSFIGMVIIAALMSNFYPNQLANFLLPQAYLVFIIPVFFTATFLFGYIFLNIQKGLTIAWGISVLVLFQLQQINIFPSVITFVLAISLTNFILISKFQKRIE